MKKNRNTYEYLGGGLLFLGISLFVLIVSLILSIGQQETEIDINEESVTSRYINVSFPVTQAETDKPVVIDEKIDESKQGILKVEENRKVLTIPNTLSENEKAKLEDIYSIQFTQDTERNGVYVINITQNTDIAALEKELEVDIETDIPVKMATDTIDWGISRIGANQVWEKGSGQGIIIAIIDTGVQKDHPDLVSNLTTGYDFVNSDTDATDDHGHGTHVAGIANATLNQVGSVGVSNSSTILPIKVLNSSGYGYLSDVAKGVYYAADNGARVINLSLGAPSDSDTLRNAILYATRKDVVIVAAAGNDGGAPCSYPAAYNEVICVMATDSRNMLASFSNIGGDISAPGVSNYSTYLGSTYKTLSGTSMASPHIAGAAALLLSICPTCSSFEIRDLINETAIDLGEQGKDILFGYGLVDLTSAVEKLQPTEEGLEEIITQTPSDETEPLQDTEETTKPVKKVREENPIVPEIYITQPTETRGNKYIPTQVGDIEVKYTLSPVDSNSKLTKVVLYLDNEEISSSTLQEDTFIVEGPLLNHSQHWVKVVAQFNDDREAKDQILIDLTYLKSLQRKSSRSVLGISTSIFDWLNIFIGR